jgi:aquaporin Z
MKNYLTEFIGTFFLVLTICLAVTQKVEPAPLAIGAALMIMVYMGGHISGAHYNPAVSLAVMMRGKLSVPEILPYVVSQILGGLAAAFAGHYLAGSTPELMPRDNASSLQAFLVEVLYTFALALVVLNVATAKKTSGNSFYGLAIGFTVTVAAFAGGPISGGCYNPAVGIALTLVKLIMGGGAIKHLWLYLAGPLVGGALAAIVFKVQEDE